MNFYVLFFAVGFLIGGGVLIYFGVTKDCNKESTPSKVDECNKSLDGSRAFIYAFAGLCLLAAIFLIIFLFIGDKAANIKPATNRVSQVGGKRRSKH